jgi:hypothetical protein
MYKVYQTSCHASLSGGVGSSSGADGDDDLEGLADLEAFIQSNQQSDLLDEEELKNEEDLGGYNLDQGMLDKIAQGYERGLTEQVSHEEAEQLIARFRGELGFANLGCHRGPLLHSMRQLFGSAWLLVNTCINTLLAFHDLPLHFPFIDISSFEESPGGNQGGDQEAQQHDFLGGGQADGSSSVPDDGGIGKYPEPQQRAYYLGDLFGKAAYLDAAYTFEQSR